MKMIMDNNTDITSSMLYDMASQAALDIMPSIDTDTTTLIDSIDNWNDIQIEHLSNSFALHHLFNWENINNIAFSDYGSPRTPIVQ